MAALASGLSPKKILDFLKKKIPSMAPGIATALASGMTAEKILGFFKKGQNFDKLKQSMEKQYPMENNYNPLVQAENVRNKNMGSDMASGLQRNIGPALGTAATAGTAYALSRAIPAILQKGQPTPSLANPVPPGNPPQSPVLPNTLPANQSQGKIASTIQQASQPPVNPNPNLPQAPNNQGIANNIPQEANTNPSQGKSIDIGDIVKKYPGFTSKIDDLLASGNGVEEISGFFRKFTTSQAAKLEKEYGKPLEEIITNYIENNPNKNPIEPTPSPSSGGQAQLPIQTNELIEPPKEQPIAKNSTVIAPQGAGEVLEVRNGQAIVEVDGKKHRVAAEDLIQSPMPEKDLADLYDDLISGIEKTTGKQVSRNVDWAGYDPKTNELAYKPHGSDKLYAYDEISPDDAQLLTSLLTKRISTGENHIGAWEADTESPIGAAMYQLIKKLQSERGGKGNEYKNKYNTIYDALEPAKIAAKRKHAERKKKTKKPRPD